VLVAGAGPVGLTAALALARQGVPVRVFEALPSLSAENRATTFHPPTLEMLDELGVAQEAVAGGIRARLLQYRDRESGFVADFDHRLLVEDTSFPFRLQFEQCDLAKLLLDRLGRLRDVEVQFASPVQGVQVTDEAVAVEIATPAGSRVVAGSYLIGADGAHSSVRQAMGIAFEGMTYPERYLRVSTSFEFTEHIPGVSFVTYVADPDEWYALLRIPGSWRVTFPITPEETDEHAIDPPRVQARLQGVVPTRAPYPVLEAIIYRVHQRVASTFRIGRVALAGDAAHLNNPLGGMGLNSGIHDAVLLANLLGQVWRGEVIPDVLDSYVAERQRVALDHVKVVTHANAQRMQERDPTIRAQDRRHLQEIAADPARARAHLLRSTMIESLRGTSLERYVRSAPRPTM
jgi:3-(3-hydroxy-phenyl)propionate hydroxylase